MRVRWFARSFLFPLLGSSALGCVDAAVAVDAAGSSSGDAQAATTAQTPTDPGPSTSTTGSGEEETSAGAVTSVGSSGLGSSSTGGSSSESSSDSTGPDAECERASGWPTTAQEALDRSCAWDPMLQVEHVGTVESTADGEVIENLHIVGGGIVVQHDGVIIRNVTVEGAMDLGEGTPPIVLGSDTADTEIIGASLGPSAPGWSEQCELPMIPRHGIFVEDGASWQMQGVAMRLVAVALDVRGGGTATVSDAFIELGQAVGPTSADDPTCARGSSFGVLLSGASAIDVRRTRLDATPWSIDEEDGAPAPIELSLMDLSVGLRVLAADTFIAFEEFALHGGRMGLQYLAIGTLSATDSEVQGVLVSPPVVLAGGVELVVPTWAGNVLDGMPWDAPG